jgi:hypothetical protein
MIYRPKGKIILVMKEEVEISKIITTQICYKTPGNFAPLCQLLNLSLEYLRFQYFLMDNKFYFEIGK